MKQKHKGLTVPELQSQITDQIISAMEEHGRGWTKCWASATPAMNGFSGHIYSGANRLTTGLAQMLNGWDDPRFVTMRQCGQAGGRVIKGSKSIPIVWYGSGKEEVEGEKTRFFSYGKIFRLFNMEQTEGMSQDGMVPLIQTGPKPDRQRNAEIECFFSNCQVPLGAIPTDPAYYPFIDQIGMPAIEDFLDTPEADAVEHYYSTLLHELVHATGAEHRLCRDTLLDYSKSRLIRAQEELIAEIGSVMLGVQFNLHTEPRADHAQYLNGWLSVLKSDNTAIFKAASAASKAIEWMEQQQPYAQQKAA